jgi:hypothetical protein
MFKWTFEESVALGVGFLAGTLGALLGSFLGYDPLYVGVCAASWGIILVYARISYDGLYAWSLALGLIGACFAFVPHLPLALTWIMTGALGTAIAFAVAASVDFVRTRAWH